MRKRTEAVALLVGLALTTPPVLAHPGGLDANGGHHNRKTGQYHCHQAPCSSEPQAQSSPVKTLASVQSASPLASASSAPSTPADEASLLVMKVVDGDTLKLSDGRTVRLIGVDTPETVHPTKPVQYFGKEASAFTKRLAEGKTVTLEYDQQKIDKYGRTLAYVYLPDGQMLNAEIVKQGFGFAYVKYPFQRMEEFRSYEREAREASMGLWADDGTAPAVPASLVSQ
jgi:micrococcal nuclease